MFRNTGEFSPSQLMKRNGSANVTPKKGDSISIGRF